MTDAFYTELPPGDSGAPKELPRPKSKAEADALPQGAEFIDPAGQTRVKPWAPKTPKELGDVPEGAEFIDPTGQTRTKPRYEGVSFTTQTLYDMAVTDREREKALIRGYGQERVKRDPAGELFVEDEGGVFRKPRTRDLTSALAKTTAELAPAIGTGVGMTLGAGAGSVIPGAGTALGMAGGGVLGAMSGQSFNDMILSLTGIYDRTPGQAIGALGWAGLGSAAGEVVGRGIAAAVPAVKAGATGLKERAGGIIQHLVGADAVPERAALAGELAQEGVRVRPSSYMMESPYLATATEVFDPKFRAQNVLQQSARDYYEKKGTSLLEDLGVQRDSPLTAPGKAISSEQAGLAAQAKAREDVVKADAALEAEIAKKKQAAEQAFGAKTTGQTQTRDSLVRAAEESRAAAQRAIDEGFKSIEKDIAAGAKTAGVGLNSGDLWWAAGEKLRAVNVAIKGRASIMYNAADRAAGGALPDVGDLPQRADTFLASLPDTFRQKYPDIVRRISDFAGEMDPKTGDWIKEPINPTFGQLRHLRSLLRSDVNYYDLTPDIRDGAFKYFSTRVNEVLHDPAAAPQLKDAAALLDRADAFYAKNMKAFKNRTIQSVVNALEAGLPADAKSLADAVLKEGEPELVNKFRKLVGPNLWAGVKAADIQQMLDESKTLIPGQIDGRKFASQVLDRIRAGTLEAVHGPDVARKLTAQAQNIEMLNGRIPIQARPGDGIIEMIERARLAGEAAKNAAKTDPLAVLQRELRKIDIEGKRALAAARAERRNDPLNFLMEPNIGAIEAADRIIARPDLFIAAANRFGEDSAEFTLLRQVAAERMLQQPIESVGRTARRAAGSIEPRVWDLMFPGVTSEQARTLAKHMDFLLGPRPDVRGTGSSIAAQTRVLNPWGSMTGLGKFAAPLKIVPGVETMGRFILTKYYALLTELATKPATTIWLTKALQGDPDAKRLAWEAVYRAMNKGGQVGAVAGETVLQQNRPTMQ